VRIPATTPAKADRPIAGAKARLPWRRQRLVLRTIG
jgi:hypothetical protein